MLKFLGRGSAFNVKEGNTSAFFIEKDSLFLIDCGEGIYERILNSNILDNINHINVLITHTHPDHVGGLPSLAMYSYYVKGQPIKILFDKNVHFLQRRQLVMEVMGCESDMYQFVDVDEYANKYESFRSVHYVSTGHVDTMESYGIMFSTNHGLVYYSGDTKDITPIKTIINSKMPIDRLYIEATSLDYPENVHLPLRVLDENIPVALREKVYCMHFNDDKCIEQATKLGFNIVEVDKSVVKGMAQCYASALSKCDINKKENKPRVKVLE